MRKADDECWTRANMHNSNRLKRQFDCTDSRSSVQHKKLFPRQKEKDGNSRGISNLLMRCNEDE